MLFAAGFGTRMRQLTEEKPKPLIHVLGRPIIHYSLEMISSCKQIKKVVINTHYHHQQIVESIEEFKKSHPKCPEIEIVYEEEILDTGGGVKNALEHLGKDPVFTLNGDVIFRSDKNLFHELEKFWDPAKMDFLMIMQPLGQSIGYTGSGDFEMDKDGKLSRPDIDSKYAYMNAGLQILKPSLIARNPLKNFSLREYYLNSDKLYGKQVKGIKWYHASSPEDLVDIEFDLMS
jgi:MurNAc alpha-1-phosphate uridylyltransferase